MRNEILCRVIDAAEYIIATGDTVRGCAHKLCVSKSTIHKDLRVRLPDIDPKLAKQVHAILEHNLAERHIRGGEATRRKYAGG